MTAVQSVLQGSPEAGEALMALMSECCDLREFGREVLRLAVNSLMSAEADSLCGAAWGQRSEGRSNSRNGYGLSSRAAPRLGAEGLPAPPAQPAPGAVAAPSLAHELGAAAPWAGLRRRGALRC